MYMYIYIYVCVCVRVCMCVCNLSIVTKFVFYSPKYVTLKLGELYKINDFEQM